MSSASRTAESLLPLTPLTYQVLLALIDGPLHGYGIIQAVEEASDGRTHVEAGTLYAALKRMLDEALIEPAGAEGRRRNYRVTAHGRAVTVAESERLQTLLQLARAKHVLPATS